VTPGQAATSSTCGVVNFWTPILVNFWTPIDNSVWNEVCRWAQVKGKTPHSARHAMGRHIMDKTGNVAAVQRQLGHKNAAYSLQYARITDDELQEVVDEW
jgi:integrase